MTKKCTFITQFNRSPETICKSGAIEFNEPSKVKESLSYAVDINTIYDNYCKTGKLPLNGNQPVYDENFINYDNLLEAQQAVKEASQYFQNLPIDIRNHYGNSLEKFVKAIHSNDKFLLDKGVLKLSKKEPELKPDLKPITPDLPKVDINTNTTVTAPAEKPVINQEITA